MSDLVSTPGVGELPQADRITAAVRATISHATGRKLRTVNGLSRKFFGHGTIDATVVWWPRNADDAEILTGTPVDGVGSPECILEGNETSVVTYPRNVRHELARHWS